MSITNITPGLTAVRTFHNCIGEETTAPVPLPVAQMLDEGWTLDAALNHYEGRCDRAICFGDHE